MPIKLYARNRMRWHGSCLYVLQVFDDRFIFQIGREQGHEPYGDQEAFL